jgi:hypothetical protein
MTRIEELMPGNLVTSIGRSATFVSRCTHPLWPHLQLVIWRMDDGTWSHDALDHRQEVGQVEPSTFTERQKRLKAALLGDPNGGRR